MHDPLSNPALRNDHQRDAGANKGKWNKRMDLYKSRRWLNKLYKLQPGLFAHCSVCQAY